MLGVRMSLEYPFHLFIWSSQHDIQYSRVIKQHTIVSMTFCSSMMEGCVVVVFEVLTFMYDDVCLSFNSLHPASSRQSLDKRPSISIHPSIHPISLDVEKPLVFIFFWIDRILHSRFRWFGFVFPTAKLRFPSKCKPHVLNNLSQKSCNPGCI